MRDDEDNDSSGVSAEGDRPSARQVINVDSEMVVFTPCLGLCFLFSANQ